MEFILHSHSQCELISCSATSEQTNQKKKKSKLRQQQQYQHTHHILLDKFRAQETVRKIKILKANGNGKSCKKA